MTVSRDHVNWTNKLFVRRFFNNFICTFLKYVQEPVNEPIGFWPAVQYSTDKLATNSAPQR